MMQVLSRDSLQLYQIRIQLGIGKQFLVTFGNEINKVN